MRTAQGPIPFYHHAHKKNQCTQCHPCDHFSKQCVGFWPTTIAARPTVPPTAAHSSSHTYPRSRAVPLVVWLHHPSRTAPGSESVQNLDIMSRQKRKMHPRHVPCGVKSDAWISPSSKSAFSSVLSIHTVSFSCERLPHDNAMGHKGIVCRHYDATWRRPGHTPATRHHFFRWSMLHVLGQQTHSCIT